MAKQKKHKNEYVCVTVWVNGELVGVWVHRSSLRAFKHICKSGYIEAFNAVVSEISDEDSERIANGEAVDL